ncbi:hypothetical protein KIPB_003769 [Kipferlia bialata]|uniref:Uncharacterized protein n=1 Tax=Kipferlia bialata TaxID=797122 RepID=A0A9K3GG18_9EUKA|nr:hypothetical protein KIPB_003769 [Kipferlia bialata]|eukprot:g3769.t1
MVEMAEPSPLVPLELDSDSESSLGPKEEENEFEWTEEHEKIAQRFEAGDKPQGMFVTQIEAQAIRSLGVKVLDTCDVHDYFRYFIAEGIRFERERVTEKLYPYDLSPTREEWKQITAAIVKGKELGFHRLSSQTLSNCIYIYIYVCVCVYIFWEGWYVYNAEAEGVDYEGNVVEIKGETRPEFYWDGWGRILDHCLPRFFGRYQYQYST